MHKSYVVNCVKEDTKINAHHLLTAVISINKCHHTTAPSSSDRHLHATTITCLICSPSHHYQLLVIYLFSLLPQLAVPLALHSCEHFLNVFWSWRWCCGHMTGSCFQHITYNELGYFFHLLPLSQNSGYTSIYEKWHKVVNLVHCYHWNPWLVSTTDWRLANQQMASNRTTNWLLECHEAGDNWYQ